MPADCRDSSHSLGIFFQDLRAVLLTAGHRAGFREGSRLHTLRAGGTVYSSPTIVGFHIKICYLGPFKKNVHSYSLPKTQRTPVGPMSTDMQLQIHAHKTVGAKQEPVSRSNTRKGDNWLEILYSMLEWLWSCWLLKKMVNNLKSLFITRAYYPASAAENRSCRVEFRLLVNQKRKF